MTHFNPVRRDLALSVGFPDIRFGEDKEYSDEVSKLCMNEYLIEQPLWHYRYSSKLDFKTKYGVKE